MLSQREDMFLKKELLQNSRAEAKGTMKCEYCGKEVGLLDVQFTWLDKKNNRAVHDKCLKNYEMETTEKKEQTKPDNQILSKPIENISLEDAGNKDSIKSRQWFRTFEHQPS